MLKHYDDGKGKYQSHEVYDDKFDIPTGYGETKEEAFNRYRNNVSLYIEILNKYLENDLKMDKLVSVNCCGEQLKDKSSNIKRRINIGEKVICSESEVVGYVVKFYTPTACEEQTLVMTDDGREYHAPTRTWVPYKDGLSAKQCLFDEHARTGGGIHIMVQSYKDYKENKEITEKIKEALNRDYGEIKLRLGR
jgi:hypothetical protein